MKKSERNYIFSFIYWLRNNLFSTPLNILLTFILSYLIYAIAVPMVDWLFINASFSGETRQSCTGNSGACWVFIKMHVNQIIYGLYPKTEYWRPNILFVYMLFIGLALYKYGPRKYIAFAVLVFVPLAAILLCGGIFGLNVVETREWGGFVLTLVVVIFGLFFGFPLAIILALMRRSKMVILRSISVVFIEIIRGVPLISVLFMASIMLPMFLPPEMDMNKLLRALIGIVLFEAAYLAEAVRSGLLSVPKGQYEAAAALGINYTSSHVFVILPQALSVAIPSIVNSFISLLKDTTLVEVIGLFDVLGIIIIATKDPLWIGFEKEAYVFAAVLFWVLCSILSRVSQKLERKYILRLSNKTKLLP